MDPIWFRERVAYSSWSKLRKRISVERSGADAAVSPRRCSPPSSSRFFPSGSRASIRFSSRSNWISTSRSPNRNLVSRKLLDLRQEPLDEVVGPRQYVLLDRHAALLSPNIFGRAAPCTQRIPFRENIGKK